MQIMQEIKKIISTTEGVIPPEVGNNTIDKLNKVQMENYTNITQGIKENDLEKIIATLTGDNYLINFDYAPAGCPSIQELLLEFKHLKVLRNLMNKGVNKFGRFLYSIVKRLLRQDQDQKETEEYESIFKQILDQEKNGIFWDEDCKEVQRCLAYLANSKHPHSERLLNILLLKINDLKILNSILPIDGTEGIIGMPAIYYAAGTKQWNKVRAFLRIKDIRGLDEMFHRVNRDFIDSTMADVMNPPIIKLAAEDKAWDVVYILLQKGGKGYFKEYDWNILFEFITHGIKSLMEVFTPKGSKSSLNTNKFISECYMKDSIDDKILRYATEKKDSPFSLSVAAMVGNFFPANDSNVQIVKRFLRIEHTRFYQDAFHVAYYPHANECNDLFVFDNIPESACELEIFCKTQKPSINQANPKHPQVKLLHVILAKLGSFVLETLLSDGHLIEEPISQQDATMAFYILIVSPNTRVNVQNGDKKAIKTSMNIWKYLFKNGANPNKIYIAASGTRKLPLHMFHGFQGQSAIQMLLEQGANINAVNPENGDSLILSTIRKNYPDNIAMLEYVIARGLDVKQTNYLGESPIKLAAELGRQDIVALIMKSYKEKYSESCIIMSQMKEALNYAADKKQYHIVKMLLEHNFSLLGNHSQFDHYRNIEIQSPRDIGLYHSLDIKMTDTLFSVINTSPLTEEQRNRERHFTLLMAVRRNNTEVIKWILEHGISFSEKESNYETAIVNHIIRKRDFTLFLLLYNAGLRKHTLSSEVDKHFVASAFRFKSTYKLFNLKILEHNQHSPIKLEFTAGQKHFYCFCMVQLESSWSYVEQTGLGKSVDTLTFPVSGFTELLPKKFNTKRFPSLSMQVDFFIENISKMKVFEIKAFQTFIWENSKEGLAYLNYKKKGSQKPDPEQDETSKEIDKMISLNAMSLKEFPGILKCMKEEITLGCEKINTEILAKDSQIINLDKKMDDPGKEKVLNDFMEKNAFLKLKAKNICDNYCDAYNAVETLKVDCTSSLTQYLEQMESARKVYQDCSMNDNLDSTQKVSIQKECFDEVKALNQKFNVKLKEYNTAVGDCREYQRQYDELNEEWFSYSKTMKNKFDHYKKELENQKQKKASAKASAQKGKANKEDDKRLKKEQDKKVRGEQSASIRQANILAYKQRLQEEKDAKRLAKENKPHTPVKKESVFERTSTRYRSTRVIGHLLENADIRKNISDELDLLNRLLIEPIDLENPDEVAAERYSLLHALAQVMEKIQMMNGSHFFPENMARFFRNAIYNRRQLLREFENDPMAMKFALHDMVNKLTNHIEKCLSGNPTPTNFDQAFRLIESDLFRRIVVSGDDAYWEHLSAKDALVELEISIQAELDAYLKCREEIALTIDTAKDFTKARIGKYLSQLRARINDATLSMDELSKAKKMLENYDNQQHVESNQSRHGNSQVHLSSIQTLKTEKMLLMAYSEQQSKASSLSDAADSFTDNDDFETSMFGRHQEDMQDIDIYDRKARKCQQHILAFTMDKNDELFDEVYAEETSELELEPVEAVKEKESSPNP